MSAGSEQQHIQPQDVHTHADLGSALRSLAKRAGLSLRDIETRTKHVRRTSTSAALPHSSIHDIFNHGRPSDAQMISLLSVCGVDKHEEGKWIDALHRVRLSTTPAPRILQRVSASDARLLGVHASIGAEGGDTDLPKYFARDFDARLRRLLKTQSGFQLILLVGKSSTGKTRSAFEAIQKSCSDWWLLQPSKPEDVSEFTDNPIPRTVIWLDEIQRLLGRERGFHASSVRRLRRHSLPIIGIGTIWPDRYHEYMLPPAPRSVDSHQDEREVLELATVIDVQDSLTTSELDRARSAAEDDPRIKVALDANDYGTTQVLAAAPHLLRQWLNAEDVISGQMLTAAIDIRRLGVETPLSADLLRAATMTYLSPRELGESGDGWFQRAVQYCSSPVIGMARAMPPVVDFTTGERGYEITDYLMQEGTRVRRRTAIPSGLWATIQQYVVDGADLQRVARSAEHRAMYGVAASLLRAASSTGNVGAELWLGVMLAKLRSYGTLENLARLGRHDAEEWLCEILQEHGDTARLARRAANGSQVALHNLCYLLEWTGDLASLRDWADQGSEEARLSLALVQAKDGDFDALRELADSGDQHADERLSILLAEHDQENELRNRVRTGHEHAAWGLANLLAQHDRVDELISRSLDGDQDAESTLVFHLIKKRDLQTLSGLLDQLRDESYREVARIAIENAQVEEVRRRIQDGDRAAVKDLPVVKILEQLRRSTDIDEPLRREIDRAMEGEPDTIFRLESIVYVSLLTLNADGGSWHAAADLGAKLVEQGDLESLWAELRAGATSSAKNLCIALEACGRTEEASNLKSFGLTSSGEIASGPTWQ